ncbi:hypothetical protein R84B8_00692 [Treponema sp. R8-4-B8]
MKSRKLWVGIPLIILVFAVVLGVVLTSCDLGIDGDGDLLLGGWYKTQAAADAGGTAPYTFTNDSKLAVVSGNTTAYYQYSVSGGSLTIKDQSGSQTYGSTTFTVTETELTLGQKCGPLQQLTYYKKAVSSGGNQNQPSDDTKAAMPDANPIGGNYTSTQTVTLSTDTNGADIYYTTTGTDPTPANGIKYTSAITISATTTLKAIAIKTGLDDSDIMTYVYTITSATPITVAPPTATPAAGSFPSTQNVTVTLTAETGAVIYYTTTDTAPTATTGTPYTNPIPIGTTTTIKAIAVINGTSSTVFEGTYTITPPVAPPTQTAITVTSGESSGANTLRDALSKIANNGTITIDPSVTVINLASQLTIGSSIAATIITIEGNGVILQPTYSATAEQSLMLITAAHTVNIRRVHFKNGIDTTTTSGNGAAIYNSGSLDINSCIFNYNRGTKGGALYNNAGNATLRGCTFYNNSATNSGGAIYVNAGTVAFVGNIFYGNTAPGANKTSGPIIYRAGGTVRSDGYNVSDVAIGTGTSQSGWEKQTTDKTLTDLSINASPFIDATNSNFTPIINTGLNSLISSKPTSFPDVDFKGATRTWPGSPGAVK